MKNKILNIIGIVAVVIALFVAFFVIKRGNIMSGGIKIENMDLNVKYGALCFRKLRICKIPNVYFYRLSQKPLVLRP